MAFRYIPCAYNDNKGEQITRNFLMDALADTDGILLGNYHLPTNTSTLECDFVLFNQYGVWIIEVKNWHGRIEIDHINWQRGDGKILHSPLISVESKANKILHRNLTPSCIYLTNDGTAKIGDFDFARVPKRVLDLMGTITIPGQPLPVKVNRHMAPELRVNARLADERSDLYALGAIWYDMLFPSLDSDEDINLSRLEETELSPDARYLLSKLLASDPKERPQRAQAVKRWLEQI